MAADYKFPKEEKLCGRLRINYLYQTGKHFTCYPLRITWAIEKSENSENSENAKYSENAKFSENSKNLFPPQVLIWAPKSLFKRAHDRNHLRRLIRESYRLNSQPLKILSRIKSKHLLVAFNYISKDLLPMEQIQKAMHKSINRLLLEIY